MIYTITVNNQSDYASHITVFQRPTDRPDFPRDPWRRFDLEPRSPEMTFEFPGINFEYAMSASFDPNEPISSLVSVENGCNYSVSGTKPTGCQLCKSNG